MQLCENVGEKLVNFAFVIQRIVFGAKILVFQNCLPASLGNELSATPALWTMVGLALYLAPELLESTILPPTAFTPLLIDDVLVGDVYLDPKIVHAKQILQREILGTSSICGMVHEEVFELGMGDRTHMSPRFAVVSCILESQLFVRHVGPRFAS